MSNSWDVFSHNIHVCLSAVLCFRSLHLLLAYLGYTVNTITSVSRLWKKWEHVLYNKWKDSGLVVSVAPSWSVLHWMKLKSPPVWIKLVCLWHDAKTFMVIISESKMWLGKFLKYLKSEPVWAFTTCMLPTWQWELKRRVQASNWSCIVMPFRL